MTNKVRYLTVTMIIFIISFMLVGCGNKNDFTEVASITFTSGGETKTIDSHWYIKIGDYQVSTKNEYDNAKFKASLMAPSDININTISLYASDLFSGKIYSMSPKPYRPHDISTDDIGKYFYIYAHDIINYNTSYYKVEIKGVGANYVKVKVIDNTTIVIQSGGYETTYTVTSYRIIK